MVNGLLVGDYVVDHVVGYLGGWWLGLWWGPHCRIYCLGISSKMPYVQANVVVFEV